MVESNAVRAMLAYGMTFGFFACFVLLVFVPLDATRMTIVGTMMGALMASWKLPLAYFYDGVPKKDPGTETTTATVTPPEAPAQLPKETTP